jgi:hypothetical protein
VENLPNSVQNSLLPLVKAMDKNIDIELRTHNRMLEISIQRRGLGAQLGHEQRLGDTDDEPT